MSPLASWHTLANLLDPVQRCLVSKTAFTADKWLSLYKLATAHLVAPCLFATLSARGELDQVPADIRDALEGLHHLNDQRNRHLRQVLRDATQALNGIGIQPILLKGANALLPEQYPHAFSRMLSDLDIAVDQAELPGAAEGLQAAGFCYAPGTEPHADLTQHRHHHLPPLFHPSGHGYIELHRSLFTDKKLQAVLPLTAVSGQARHWDWDGLWVRIPSLEHRLLHNALHHQWQDGAFFYGRRSLRQLWEFTQLRALPAAAEIDWPVLLCDLDRHGVGNAVRAYLLAALNDFGQPLPTGVIPTSSALRAERRFQFRLRHPRLGHWREQLIRYPRRLTNLPRRLMTPSWYPAKYRYLRKQWFPDRAPINRDDHG